MPQNEQQLTHIAIAIGDANALLDIVNELPTKFGAHMLEILKKAQPFKNQTAPLDNIEESAEEKNDDDGQ
jgi:hypothetical protein